MGLLDKVRRVLRVTQAVPLDHHPGISNPGPPPEAHSAGLHPELDSVKPRPEVRLWYERLADVPHLDYVTPVSVDAAALPERGLRPRLATTMWNGTNKTSPEWIRDPRGYGSRRSPATEWKGYAPQSGESEATAAMRRVHEALALPGTLTDYYFVLLGGIQAAWSHRAGNPWLYQELERLSLLAIALVECHQDALSADNDGRIGHLGVPAYDMLLTIYGREGHLVEMQDIVRRATEHHVGDFSRKEQSLAARVAAIEGLDAG